MEDKSVLVTGASGVLGWNVCRYLAGKTSRLVGTSRMSRPVMNGVDFVPLSLDDPEGVRRFFSEHRFDVVVHSAAMTNPDECEKSKELAWRINVEATQAIAEGLQKESLLIYISTDLVFDGTRGRYCEKDRPNPTNLYGLSKLEAESAIRKRDNSVVVRVAKLYSNGSPFHPCFTNWMIDRFEAGQKVPLFVDQYRTPVLARDVARALEVLIRRSARAGLYHLGGGQRLSRFEFGRHLAAVFGYAESQIEPVRFCESNLVKRGGDCSLDSRRFCTEFDFKQTETEVGLREVLEERRNEGEQGRESPAPALHNGEVQ